MIEIRGLQKAFGAVGVLRGIDLDIADGEVVALIGRSGCGKTTLLRCINFLETYEAGEIRLDAQRLWYRTGADGVRRRMGDAEARRMRQQMGIVFQQYNLFPHMTVLDNVVLGPRFSQGVSALEAEGIGVAGLATAPDAATGTALIVVDARGRNQIAVAPGANRCLPPSAVERWETDFAWADVVLCQLETPVETVVRALELARARGKVTILNPAPVRDVDPSVWPLVDYLTPNESEAARLGGVSVAGPGEAAVVARALRARGARAVIVTLGARGALASGPAGDLVVPAFPVTAVDTTAAGDAFNGALAVGLAEGAALWPALRLATAAAALACTKRGARPSLPGRAEVDALLDRAGPVDR